MLEQGHKACRVIIIGRVQGVFFRDWTAQNANGLKLDGWVRNRADGTVEALFVGLDKNVDKIIELCHIGPPSAKVDEIDVIEAMGITKKGFVIKPTVDLEARRGF